MKNITKAFLSTALSVLIITCSLFGVCITADALDETATVTVGGVDYKLEVGDSFTYRMELTVPQIIECAQFVVKFSDNVVNNPDIYSNPSLKTTDSSSESNVWFNPNIPNEININFSDISGYDFTKKTWVFENVFRVTKSGSGSIYTSLDEGDIAVYNMQDKDISSSVTVNDTITGLSVEKSVKKQFKPDPEDKNVAGFRFNSDITYSGIRLLGVQKKKTADNSFRFISVASSDILSDPNVEDYGYVLWLSKKSTADAKQSAGGLTAQNGTKISCYNSTNNISEGYGDNDWTSTNYKYVTLAINNVPNSDSAVVARFYVKTKDGGYSYASYTDKNGNEFDGCAIRWNEIID